MAIVTTRQSVGRPLTHAELDQNFSSMNEGLGVIEGDMTGSHAPGGAFANPIFNQFEASTLKDSSMFEYMAEILRGLGGSGIYNTRQYNSSGTSPYHRVHDISYAALNMHDHPNFIGTCGMAEVSAILNGYYVRTRHNDYQCLQMANAPIVSVGAGNKWYTTKDVVLPTTPPSVTAAPDVNAQIAEMQQYFKAFATKNTALRDYRNYFRWNLSYLEMWIEELTPEAVDGFTSLRHINDAASNRDMVEKNLYFNGGGHKNRLENLTFNNNVIRFTDSSGQPKLGRVMHRILVKDLGPVQGAVDGSIFAGKPGFTAGTQYDHHPNTICHLMDDYPTKAAKGSLTALNKWARFRIDTDATVRSIGSPQRIDAFMSLVPGFDGDGAATLEERYNLNVGGSILNDVITDYGTVTPKNSRYYNRWYATTAPDASGRSDSKRGFNDPTLWVARTTNPQVMGVGVDALGEPYRFTYAIPLEMVLRTPLHNWNPLNLVAKDIAIMTAENPNDNVVAYQKIHSGYSVNRYRHLTPSSFYSGQPVEIDNASTDALSIRIVSAVDMVAAPDANGQRPAAAGSTIVGEVRNCGIYAIMPPITVGADTYNIRMRYPCYPTFNDGSRAAGEAAALWKEVNALKAQIANLYTT